MLFQITIVISAGHKKEDATRKAQGDPSPLGEGRNCAYSPPLNRKVFILIVVSPN